MSAVRSTPKTMVGFPVPRRMQDINKLATLLNGAGLSGNWHFVRGSRFDQEWIEIEFDRLSDGELASLTFSRA